jgi:hypothetical protein
MKPNLKKLEEAVRDKSLTPLTKALGELADELGYQLKPPYTEVLNLKAKEEDDRFGVKFTAELHLHYSTLERSDEDLIFVVRFGGEAPADSPAPPIDQLFYAAVVESLTVYGYGSRWQGTILTTPAKYRENLEVTADRLSRIELADLYRSMGERSRSDSKA